MWSPLPALCPGNMNLPASTPGRDRVRTRGQPLLGALALWACSLRLAEPHPKVRSSQSYQVEGACLPDTSLLRVPAFCACTALPCRCQLLGPRDALAAPGVSSPSPGMQSRVSSVALNPKD